MDPVIHFSADTQSAVFIKPPQPLSQSSVTDAPKRGLRCIKIDLVPIQLDNTQV